VRLSPHQPPRRQPIAVSFGAPPHASISLQQSAGLRFAVQAFLFRSQLSSLHAENEAFFFCRTFLTGMVPARLPSVPQRFLYASRITFISPLGIFTR